ncbi:MAG: N-acetylmuramic acid 6-phosphate etherase [Bacteroidetes bacterium]|nr:MAG: N-acetylmuramic acid 6-phosphate etherase [Bacteroidota bacterium]
MDNRTTEQDSRYQALETLSTTEILQHINAEDHLVAPAVQAVIPQIEALVEACLVQMQKGGRLFYLGAGTSGRLGIVDASECPPTFGVPHGMVVGIIAGGDQAIRKAVEFAEDNTEQGWKDLQEHQINTNDFVVGITASGTAPYVLGAIAQCNEMGIPTGAITCNLNSPLGKLANYPIECVVGPEFITGSTRMKSGTAQKLILNMISSSLMIRLGRVKGNKMVDMQLSNDKLVDRGTRMVMESISVDYQTAQALLLKEGSVRAAVEAFKKDAASK